MAQDIYKANNARPIQNGSLVVGLPGVEVSTSGLNTSYSSTFNAALNIATISGKYGGKPSGRFDDTNFYEGEKTAGYLVAGTAILSGVATQFATGICPKCIAVLVNRSPTGVNVGTAYVGTKTQQLLALTTTDYKGYNIDISDASLLYVSGTNGDTLSWTVFI